MQCTTDGIDCIANTVWIDYEDGFLKLLIYKNCSVAKGTTN